MVTMVCRCQSDGLYPATDLDVEASTAPAKAVVYVNAAKAHFVPLSSHSRHLHPMTAMRD